jgi:Trypsin-like peptidase domain
MRRGLLILAAALLMVFPAMAQTPSSITAAAKKSIVYLHVQGITSTGETEDLKTASGFMISSEGHFITALHVLQDKDGKAYSRYKQIFARVGGGKYTSRDIVVEVLEAPADSASDLALLKLVETEYRYEPVSYCPAAPETGQALVAYGFPGGEEFTPRDGKFANRSGGRYWQVGIDFSWGMSGGPVYDSGGLVRGVIKGGRRDASEVRWIVPIRDADLWLRRYRVKEKCGEAEPGPHDTPPPAAAAPAVTIDKPYVILNQLLPNPAGPGMPPFPGFDIGTSVSVNGAKGKRLQVMALFSAPGAPNYYFANAAEPFYRNPQGLVATTTPIKLLPQDRDVTQVRLPFPLYALNLMPTGYRTYYPVVVHILAFLDDVLVAQNFSEQFVIAW